MPQRRDVDSTGANKAQRQDPTEQMADEMRGNMAAPNYASDAAAQAAMYGMPQTGGGGGGLPFGMGSGETAYEGSALPTAGASQSGLGQAASKGLLGKIFGKGGMIDPMTAILGGLSLFGKDQALFQPRQSFAGTTADPVKTLTTSLDAIKNLSASMAARGAPQLKSAIVPEGPAPVSIDGIPFQIGGGLGRDPALSHPEILQGSAPLPDPFAAKQQPASPGGAVRRKP